MDCVGSRDEKVTLDHPGADSKHSLQTLQKRRKDQDSRQARRDSAMSFGGTRKKCSFENMPDSLWMVHAAPARPPSGAEGSPCRWHADLSTQDRVLLQAQQVLKVLKVPRVCWDTCTS
ncbi:uncharacterized protein LOC120884943 isoform X2 [Ictidomys tridecemlineatus]